MTQEINRIEKEIGASRDVLEALNAIKEKDYKADSDYLRKLLVKCFNACSRPWRKIVVKRMILSMKNHIKDQEELAKIVTEEYSKS